MTDFNERPVAYQRTYFGDMSGKALDSGKLFIGQPQQDPEVYPMGVFLDPDLTIPASQPLSISAGYVIDGGMRKAIYTAAASYSLRVRDRNDVQIDYVPEVHIPDIEGAVQDAVDTVVRAASWSDIDASPTVVFGFTSQNGNLEGGEPKVMITRSNDLGFLQVNATARDKTLPPDLSEPLRITGLPFVANGIQPQPLQLEPDTGLPSDTYAALVGDTIGFYRPGRVPVTADMVADNYYLRVSGIVAILPSETFE